MKIRIYNSLSNKLETFKPIKEGQISMYVCGPTVYNYQHIGNARPIVVFDVFKRFFEYVGYKVKYVSNLTDVDDKIINAAIKEGVLEEDITSKYSEAYFKLIDDLNCNRPDVTPRVTETMSKIISFIEDLMSSGYAYEVNGDVYFRIDKLEEYGILSNINKEDLLVGSRVETNEDKESPLDFTLWKKTKEGIKWDSSWSRGRPGWHSECVVMIKENFNNEKIDIHGGGNDLKFPHHENEIAQSRALNNHSIANYWIHNGMITIDDEKMSKSLGNLKWAKDLIEEHGGNVIRMVLLSSPYRSPLNFSKETIDNSKNEVERIIGALKQAHFKMSINDFKRNNDFSNELMDEFVGALADDLNTPNALSVTFETVKWLNQAIRGNSLRETNYYYNTLLEQNKVLGLKYEERVLTKEERELYFDWQELIKIKDFINADRLRQQLMDKGII